MRTFPVYSLEDEAAWERAKEIAEREYPEATGSNYWNVVESVFIALTTHVPKSRHGEHDPVWRMSH